MIHMFTQVTIKLTRITIFSGFLRDVKTLWGGDVDEATRLPPRACDHCSEKRLLKKNPRH